MILATVSVASVPLSTNVKRVLGEPLESLMVKVPSLLDAPRVTTGVVFERTMGAAPESVTVLFAEIVVAPEIAPAFVMPPA